MQHGGFGGFKSFVDQSLDDEAQTASLLDKKTKLTAAR